ncbi:NADP-dependent oxidoreductase [Mumia sp. ZJ1417]|uniref:NADP-dependent oxidoreductase n=1 Tax=Mumia sp. ZJ1417 TaxID=2708082 RepID=UPI001AB03E82|nr:NADP-dependent oxidoreductase [Mumia sp. ZJ1417]
MTETSTSKPASTGPYASRQVRLRERPVGYPGPQTWDLTTTDLPEPGPGELVVAVSHVSLDPAMRGWLNDVRSYVPPVGIGEVMRAGAAGTVVASQHPSYAVGDTVTGSFGVTEYALSDGEGLVLVDPAVAGTPTWLGALGMPGMTAYFGLLDVGRASAGDTVLVSGAAGAVGSIVGQIAKALGCTVIGIAGGADKCDWLTSIGFDAVIDYKAVHDSKPVNVLKRLRDVAPDGIDVFFDNVGGDTLDAGLANLRRGARVVICGAISGTTRPRSRRGRAATCRCSSSGRR